MIHFIARRYRAFNSITNTAVKILGAVNCNFIRKSWNCWNPSANIHLDVIEDITELIWGKGYLLPPFYK